MLTIYEVSAPVTTKQTLLNTVATCNTWGKHLSLWSSAVTTYKIAGQLYKLVHTTNFVLHQQYCIKCIKFVIKKIKGSVICIVNTPQRCDRHNWNGESSLVTRVLQHYKILRFQYCTFNGHRLRPSPLLQISFALWQNVVMYCIQ